MCALCLSPEHTPLGWDLADCLRLIVQSPGGTCSYSSLPLQAHLTFMDLPKEELPAWSSSETWSHPHYPWKLFLPSGSPSTAWQGLTGGDFTVWLVREKGLVFVYMKEMKYSLPLGKCLLCSQVLSALKKKKRIILVCAFKNNVCFISGRGLYVTGAREVLLGALFIMLSPC